MTAGNLIPRSEQDALAREYRRTGDRALEDKLVRSQLRLVATLARKHARDEQKREELFQEGSLALIHAVRRYDPARGVSLSSYAAWWIRAYQLRWLLANHRLVRIGKNAAERRIFFNARRLRGQLESAGVEVTTHGLADQLRVSDSELAGTLRRIDVSERSIDAPLGDGTPSDLLADPRVLPDEAAATAEREGCVAREAARFAESLTGRARVLFASRWLSGSPPTLASLGKRLGVSRERVRQLEARLLKQFRAQIPTALAA